MAEGDDWVPSAASRARVEKRLREIDQAHLAYPSCWLCGQRARNLDEFGLCSKISEPHKAERKRISAEMQSRSGVL